MNELWVASALATADGVFLEQLKHAEELDNRFGDDIDAEIDAWQADHLGDTPWNKLLRGTPND